MISFIQVTRLLQSPQSGQRSVIILKTYLLNQCLDVLSLLNTVLSFAAEDISHYHDGGGKNSEVLLLSDNQGAHQKVCRLLKCD